MSRDYFGTDGIRGRVGEYPITPDFALHLGWAVGQVMAQKGERKVVIGKDTRISGYMFESALEAGLAAAGVTVMLLGPMPTPAIAYLTRTLGADAGIVISASHNPYHDNGIKFFSREGMKLADSVEMEIEAALKRPLRCVSSEKLGKAYRIDDAPGRYIEFCKGTFPYRFDLRGFTLVIDSAHGATYHIAPSVFTELGATVIPLGVEPNGLNINVDAGSTEPQALIEAVRHHRADMGIAFDGDGDRVLFVDGDGRLIDGDELLYILAVHGKQRPEGVVGTLMTNLGVERALQQQGVVMARAAVGDRYVLELLQQRQWHLGAEGSGHIIDLSKTTTGDGIVAALQVLAVLVSRQLTLAQALAGVERYPQQLCNVKLGTAAAEIMQSPALQQAVAAAEEALAGRGRVLLRPSGTEPLLRVMVEGEEWGRVVWGVVEGL
ncbi:phosphoglucosamine mutase [Ectothiorhodospiraceae bacterium BW-2]|nr:phosphoglucosamine mutase [Ectothiorhodospiraceae bacterium BW-2]